MPFPENVLTKFVLRNAQGAICGVFTNRQEDATEELAADDAEIAAFLAPKTPDISAAEMQAQRERQIENTIERLGVGATAARLTVIEDGIRLLLKR